MAKRRVLVIAHNWRLRKLIRANLEALGFSVQEAVDEQHGLQRLREEHPDLILLDIDLPGGEALSLLPAIQQRSAAEAVPIVLIAADPPRRELLQRAEVTGYLLKPFDVLSLLERVQSLINGSTVADPS